MSDNYNNAGAWAGNVGVPPDGDPMFFSVPGLVFPVANVEGLPLDFTDEHIRSKIKGIQSVYIDNRSQYVITLRVGIGPVYRIDAKGQTQGWYVIPMQDDWPLFLRSSGVIADPTLVNLLFTNINLYASQYATA